MTTLNERDQITLNAYLDGMLSARERTAFEERLANNPALQRELESLRATVAVLKMAKPISVPRNFTLDPAVYGKPIQRSWLARLGLSGTPRLAMAGAALVATLICAGVLISGMPRGSTAQPAMVSEQEETADRAEADRAVEAPQAAAQAQPTEEATEITAFAAPAESGADQAAEAGGGPAGAAPQSTQPPPSERSAAVGPATEEAAGVTMAQTATGEALTQSPQPTTEATEPPTQPSPTPSGTELPTRPTSIALVALGVLIVALLLGIGMARLRRQRS